MTLDLITALGTLPVGVVIGGLWVRLAAHRAIVAAETAKAEASRLIAAAHEDKTNAELRAYEAVHAAQTELQRLRAATLQEAVAAGLVDQAELMPPPRATNTCGCGHSKAFHDPPAKDGETTCNARNECGGYTCACAQYVEAAPFGAVETMTLRGLGSRSQTRKGGAS